MVSPRLRPAEGSGSTAGDGRDGHRIVVGDGDAAFLEVHRHGAARRRPAHFVGAGRLADREARADAPAPTAIPAAIQGRWGLVPADCEPGRDDAKGLLTIGADKLDFYESTGTLDTISEAAPTRIRAAFDFTGEGMTWQREVVLDVQDDGATLIRREYGQDAAPGPFRYARCQQGR